MTKVTITDITCHTTLVKLENQEIQVSPYNMGMKEVELPLPPLIPRHPRDKEWLVFYIDMEVYITLDSIDNQEDLEIREKYGYSPYDLNKIEVDLDSCIDIYPDNEDATKVTSERLIQHIIHQIEHEGVLDDELFELAVEGVE